MYIYIHTCYPKQPLFKWLFQLDDSKSLHKQRLSHHFHPLNMAVEGTRYLFLVVDFQEKKASPFRLGF